MNPDILDMFNAALGGPVIRQASANLGETEHATRAAVRCAGPALLAALVRQVATPEGTGPVFRLVTGDTVDQGIAAKLPGLFANRGTLSSLLSSGEAMTDSLLGPRATAVSVAIADVSGVRAESARSLLSLGAPMLLGTLKKLAANNDLDAAALGLLVQRQGASLARSGIDDRIARALGADGTGDLLGALAPRASGTAQVMPATRAKGKDWLPWAIAAGIAVFGVLFFVSRTADHQEIPGGAVQIAEVSPDTDATGIAVAENTAQDRVRLAGAADASRQGDERPVQDPEAVSEQLDGVVVEEPAETDLDSR